MHVYAYQVAAAKSDYHIVVPGELAKDLVTAYHGLIFIDDRKHFIHRITLHADGIPPGVSGPRRQPDAGLRLYAHRRC